MKPELHAQFVMATSDFKQWIVLKDDRPAGTPSTELCISLKGRDLQVQDYRHDSAPLTVTGYRFDPDEARAQCDKYNEINETNVGCNERSAVLSRYKERLGERLAFQGMEVTEEGKDGVLWTLVASPDGEQGFTSLGTFRQGATIQGATIMSGFGGGFQLSPALINYLDQRM